MTPGQRDAKETVLSFRSVSRIDVGAAYECSGLVAIEGRRSGSPGLAEHGLMGTATGTCLHHR